MEFRKPGFFALLWLLLASLVAGSPTGISYDNASRLQVPVGMVSYVSALERAFCVPVVNDQAGKSVSPLPAVSIFSFRGPPSLG